MRNYTKKIFALVLSLLMLCSVSAPIASAATFKSTNNTPESSGDYAYWNGKKTVRSSSTTVSEVKWIQDALNFCITELGLNATKLAVDGSFGPASKAATLKFQKATGLTQDGSFGPSTIKKMKTVLSNKTMLGTKTIETYQLYWPVAKSKHKIGGLGANSDFGPRNTGISGASTDHKGIDLGIATGTSIYAVAKGKVTDVGYNDYRGYYVVIYHEDLGISTLYQHLKKGETKVKENDSVSAGKVIAKSGSTGIGSGPHLHFGVMTGKATGPNRDQSHAINPMGSNISYTYYK